MSDGEFETWWDSGDVEYPQPPVTADHTPERLTREGLGRLLDRLLTEHWPNSGLNPWYLADLIREHDAAHLADVEAWLAAVEALVRELHISGDLTPAGTDALLRALHPAPSEGRP